MASGVGHGSCLGHRRLFFFLTGAPGMELLPNVAGSQRDAVRNRCSIEKDQNTGTAQGKNTSKKSRVVERKKKKEHARRR